MEQNSKNVPVWYKNEEEQQLAEYLIGLEKAALDKWFDGDTSGYEQLWSKHSFTYFDSVSDKRVDDHETIAQFLKTIDGKLFAQSYDFRVPRVQIGKDMAVLTYQLFADTSLINRPMTALKCSKRKKMASGM